MAPELARTLPWLAVSTRLWKRALDRASDPDLAQPSALPGWTRAHVVAHVALNAEALSNLVRWARTGEETPMYPSREVRDADIEELAGHDPEELRTRSRTASERLAEGLASLPPERWQARVRTMQGVEVPATTIVWMRTREVALHAIDLDTGVGAHALGEDLASALVDDVVRQRSRTPDHPALSVRVADSDETWVVGQVGPDSPQVSGQIQDLAAYLTGRRPEGELTSSTGEIPELPPWL